MQNIVAGNWKMNLNKAEALSLANQLKIQIQESPIHCELVICPPFPWITLLAEELKNSLIQLGAQNCAAQTSGAFTGEVSASMLASAGVSYVILGHSERRTLFGDTDALVLEKCKRALEAGLKVILCCGESLEERDAGNAVEVVYSQLRAVLENCANLNANNLVIAYEPVWAIGTGRTASPEQAAEIHDAIRTLLCKHFGNEIGNSIRLQYGGSCNAANAAGLFAKTNINGGLIGGASLKAEDFLSIARAC
jgi:triosephosphate isomerase